MTGKERMKRSRPVGIGSIASKSLNRCKEVDVKFNDLFL